MCANGDCIALCVFLLKLNENVWMKIERGLWPEGARYFNLLAARIADRNNLAITITRVPALPFGVNIGLHGVATRHLKPRQRQQNCLASDGTIYCGQFTSDDYRTTLIGLTGLLQKFTGPKANIVASYVFLDDLKEFAAMNKLYAELIPEPLPTRTTVQPAPAGTSPKLRISVVAEQ